MIPAILVSASLAIPAALPREPTKMQDYVDTLAGLRSYQIVCPPEPAVSPVAIIMIRTFIDMVEPKAIPLADQRLEQILAAIGDDAGKAEKYCEMMRPAVVKANKDFGGG